MSLVVEMLSASLRIVATRSTVGKAENSSGFWIHNATIRMSTESAIDSARPKSIITAGTGRKNRQRMSTMPTAKAMSLPPRFAAGAVPTAVNDIAALALEEPAHGAPAREDMLRTLREDRTERCRVGHERSSVYSRDEDYGREAIAADTIELSGSLEAKRSWRLPNSIGCLKPYL